MSDQSAALRLVVLADRLYDRDVPLVTSGVPLDRLFPTELLEGGYRKKYLRAVSRLTALAQAGAGVLTCSCPGSITGSWSGVSAR